jgi:hypothetical protein
MGGVLSSHILSGFFPARIVNGILPCLSALLVGALLFSPLAAASAPAVTLSPGSLTFGQQVLGTTSPVQTVGLPAISLTKTLRSIAITPANPTVSPGATEQFHATGTFSDGSTQDLTKSVTWSSSKTAVATISNTSGTQGLATALASGTTTIQAAHGTIKGTTLLTVSAPTLVSITVTPAASSIAQGAQQQFTATGNYSDGSTQNLTNTATWSSSAPSVATIGTKGLASAVGPGQTTIEAAVGAINGSTTLTVNPLAHVYVVFPPSTGVNNTHFMNTVMNQPAIDGVTVPVPWITAETGTPGPGTCSLVGTDVCQQDAFGWTHTYDWTSIDAANAQWFAAQAGAKKVNMLLFGMSGASNICQATNTCANRFTPYYVTTSSWAAHTAATNEDFINGSRDGCSNYLGLSATSMTRDHNGLVTVTENGHGYVNGDTIWITGSTPANYNIAQENVTNVQVASSVLTITATNSFPAGIEVTFRNLKKATFLNGQTVTVLTSSATQFTATFVHVNYGPTKETAGTANPQGVTVQNAKANTFQYQSGIKTANSATTPGTVISVQQSWPVPYETPYKTAWESFIAAAIVHFNASPHLSQIAYMRVGRSVGGEAYPYCTGNLESLPSPNTYTKAGWLQYYTDIADFVQAQNPVMQIMDPLNEAGVPTDPSYGTAEAEIAVAHENSLGNVNGFGSQGMKASDISDYNQNPPAYCASDWCGTFNTYDQTVPNLELQQRDLSDPIGLTGTLTGDLRPLIPFALERHMTILEVYTLDALLAYDPNYCVLTVPDTGVCTTGSISVAATDLPPTDLPPQDQYPYFQAVGQPGQKGATGDGSYAFAINSTE